MVELQTLDEGRVYSLSYRCRDIGYGVEEGEGDFIFWGSEDIALQPRGVFDPTSGGPTVHLFEDELGIVEPAVRS